MRSHHHSRSKAVAGVVGVCVARFGVPFNVLAIAD
jgi:hypothetical protein